MQSHWRVFEAVDLVLDKGYMGYELNGLRLLMEDGCVIKRMYKSIQIDPNLVKSLKECYKGTNYCEYFASFDVCSLSCCLFPT